MMIKVMRFALLLMIVLSVGNVLANACVFAFKDELVDSDTEALYSDPSHKVCLVEIKASTETFSFSEDACNECYCVTGIGTSEARVYEKDFDRDCVDPCHDISNVQWYHEEKPTAVQVSNLEVDSSLAPFLIGFVISVVILALISSGVIIYTVIVDHKRGK